LHKSGVFIDVYKEDKEGLRGNLLYSCNHRKSKAIQLFLIHSIKEKDVLKSDVLDVIWNTMQFQNIFDFFKTRNKIKKEDD
jgi:hypothetical protein